MITKSEETINGATSLLSELQNDNEHEEVIQSLTELENRLDNFVEWMQKLIKENESQAEYLPVFVWKLYEFLTNKEK